MDHPKQQQQQGNDQEGSNGKGFLCRQSSTRWTPTTDQIRILKELYYNNGVRSPSADQIQRISARLRQYGKIEGKNVFYWFQNHKARERQKKDSLLLLLLLLLLHPLLIIIFIINSNNNFLYQNNNNKFLQL